MRRTYHGDDLYFGGWVVNRPIFDRERTDEENDRIYHSCAVYTVWKGCGFFMNGTFHACARCMQGTHHGAIPTVKNVDYLDIHDPSLSIEEKRQVIRNMQNARYLTACRYCDGNLGTEDLEKRVVPAEQLPR